VDYKPGQLIRWIEDWNTYTASPEGVVRGYDPNYRHAIITSVALDNSSVVAYCYDCTMLEWILLSPAIDHFEIISEEK
tara:strand:- start:1008 stop:1241 length:234 start_codon:yes stop_codon:yes gene_type:complete